MMYTTYILKYISQKGCRYMENLFDATLLITRYDRNYEHCADLYDNLPYARDFDFCNGPLDKSKSGNVIKYYLYQLAEPAYHIALQPELMDKRIREYQIQAADRQTSEVIREDEPEITTGITSEQMESLLSDPDAGQSDEM